MVNSETNFEIIECICSWYDLLGFGKPLVDSKWNLNDERCWTQLERINSIDLSYTNRFSSNHGTVNLSMNDGIISTFDIDRTKAGFKSQLVFVLDDLINEFESLNFRDTKAGFPGMRGILTFGHRYNYTHVESTVALINNKTIAYHPPEFQMNTAFSKAYIMESSGSKAGISGNNLYVDKHLLDSIEHLILDQKAETPEFRIESQLEDNFQKKYFSIYRNSNMLLKIEFDTNTVKYDHQGINTTLFKFLKRESWQDQLAHEAAFRQAQRYAQMDNDEAEDNE
jgi:hypothetical protein